MDQKAIPESCLSKEGSISTELLPGCFMLSTGIAAMLGEISGFH
jgi:hypothetical protein